MSTFDKLIREDELPHYKEAKEQETEESTTES